MSMVPAYVREYIYKVSPDGVLAEYFRQQMIRLVVPTHPSPNTQVFRGA